MRRLCFDCIEVCAVPTLGLSLRRAVCMRTTSKRANPRDADHHPFAQGARALSRKGITDYENLYLERCNEDWRQAVKEDPNLAVAWAWIAFNSGNPQEVSEARAKAKALAPKTDTGRTVDGRVDLEGAGR